MPSWSEPAIPAWSEPPPASAPSQSQPQAPFISPSPYQTTPSWAESRLAPTPAMPQPEPPFDETPAWARRPQAPGNEVFLAAAAAPVAEPAPIPSSHGKPLEIVRLDAGEASPPPARRIVVPVEIDPQDLDDGGPIELVLRIEVKGHQRRAS